MTPKEKAQELWWKYFHAQSTEENENLDGEIAYQCALIAVDEIIEFMEADDFDSDTCYWANHSKMEYWMEVKKEIEKL